MSLIERIKQTNLFLVRRVEMASGFSPLCNLGDEKIGVIVREAARARRWEDVPESHRTLIEQAEAAAKESALHPVPFLGKA